MLLASILADQRKVEACETGVVALRIASDVRLLLQQSRVRPLINY